MRLRDLVTDPGTHTLSHSKLWSHIGNATLTVVFFRDAWFGGLTDMKILAYGAVVAGHAVLSKAVSMKWGNSRGLPPTPPLGPPDRW